MKSENPVNYIFSMAFQITIIAVLFFLTINGAKTGTLMNNNKGKTLEDFMIGKKLYNAASHGNLNEVKRLTHNKCMGVHWQDVFWSTPLHTAALNNHLEVVKFLLSCNADPNRQTLTGWTPLMYASRSADVDVINALLTANPDLDVQKLDGWTALMLAANTKRVDNAKALIRAGASLDLKNGFGKTAEDIAIKRGSMEISQLIIQDAVNKTTIPTNTLFMLDIFLAFVVFIVVSLTIGVCLYLTTTIISVPSSVKRLMVFTIEEDKEILHNNEY